jgi:hypothetical protein
MWLAEHLKTKTRDVDTPNPDNPRAPGPPDPLQSAAFSGAVVPRLESSCCWMRERMCALYSSPGGVALELASESDRLVTSCRLPWLSVIIRSS